MHSVGRGVSERRSGLQFGQPCAGSPRLCSPLLAVDAHSITRSLAYSLTHCPNQGALPGDDRREDGEVGKRGSEANFRLMYSTRMRLLRGAVCKGG